MLREIPLFSRLDDKAINDLENVAMKRAYPKNTVLVTKGDKSDQLFVVLKGKLKVAVTDASGKEIIMSLLGPSDYFGEIAVIDGESRSATIMTTQASEVLTISRNDFHRTLMSNPELMFELLKVLARKVRIATEKLESLAFEDVYGRLVKLLIQLARPHKDLWIVEDRLTHQEIANMIGSSREMVTRILKALTSGDFISIDRKRITIKRKLPATF